MNHPQQPRDWDTSYSEVKGAYAWPSVQASARTRREPPATLAALARRGEWHARPPGRLGRRLLPEIESYLEFFAVARG